MIPTIVFALILLTAVLIIRGASRTRVLVSTAVTALAVLLLFNHHVTEPLGLSF